MEGSITKFIFTLKKEGAEISKLFLKHNSKIPLVFLKKTTLLSVFYCKESLTTFHSTETCSYVV